MRLFILNNKTKMKISEFRKLIREEVRKVIKEASTTSQGYQLSTTVPVATLKALSKYIDVKNIKPTHEMDFRTGNKKIYTIRIKGSIDLKKVLDNAPFDKLLQVPAYIIGSNKTSGSNQASDIEDYFSDYDVKITSRFNLEKFAKSIQQSKKNAEALLLNLEDKEVMKDIANGVYDSFNMFSDAQFNDDYDKMMQDLKIKGGH